jgi:hypothetical protein
MMKTLLLAAVMGVLSTAVWAEEALPPIKLKGLVHLEAGDKMYRKVPQEAYEIGDVVELKDERDVSMTKHARILRVGNKSVVFEVVAGME